MKMAWTVEEVAYLKDNYATKTVKEIATDLSKNYFAVREYIRRMGLSKSHKWSVSEIEFMRESRDKMSIEELAFILGRTPAAIYTKIYSLSDKSQKPIDNVKPVKESTVGTCIIYTLWDNKTDDIVANGTAEECAKNMDMSLTTFYSTVSRASHNQIQKYSVVKQRVKREEYE